MTKVNIQYVIATYADKKEKGRIISKYS